MEKAELLKKYTTAAPRYTSYPTVPCWDLEDFSTQKWKAKLQQSYVAHGQKAIGLYIHLPYCESLCTYCGCNTRITKNHNVELPYIQGLVKEWDMYRRLLGETPKIKEIHLGGGTPTFFSAHHLERLVTHLVGDGPTDITGSFEAHPANTTLEHLAILHQLNFKRLSLGIQDFDPKVQFMINRFQTPQQVLTVVNNARNIGYESINFDLIYGLPGQTLSGLKQTIDESLRMRPDRIAFYSYAHVPWMKPGQRHFDERDIPQGNEKNELYEMGRTLLLEAGYEEIGMDHFALKTDSLFTASKNNQLHRNFMGYTDNHTPLLIGLGVSAISDSHSAFAQNLKTVESYLTTLEENKFPVERGHILTDTDQYFRQHILNLMCRGETRFCHLIPPQVLNRLLPMVEDGIVEIKGLEVKIPAKGMRFLRNICTAFDERLLRKQPSEKVFSSSI